jgi:hypothetical protein
MKITRYDFIRRLLFNETIEISLNSTDRFFANTMNITEINTTADKIIA